VEVESGKFKGSRRKFPKDRGFEPEAMERKGTEGLGLAPPEDGAGLSVPIFSAEAAKKDFHFNP
jgi:hypothetical protein